MEEVMKNVRIERKARMSGVRDEPNN